MDIKIWEVGSKKQQRKPENNIITEKPAEKIADLVQKSHEARKKAKELLEEVKQKVEEMIEKKSNNV